MERLAFRLFMAAVVLGGGFGVAVAHELLQDREIDAGLGHGASGRLVPLWFLWEGLINSYTGKHVPDPPVLCANFMPQNVMQLIAVITSTLWRQSDI